MYYDLKLLRKKLNVGLVEMANKLNYPKGNLSKIDNQKRTMNLALLYKIKELYNVEPEELLKYIIKD